MSLVGSPIRSPGGSGEEERGGRGPAGRNSKEKHVERKGPGPRAGKKRQASSCSLYGWDTTVFSRITRAPAPTDAAEISGWVLWMHGPGGTLLFKDDGSSEGPEGRPNAEQTSRDVDEHKRSRSEAPGRSGTTLGIGRRGHDWARVRQRSEFLPNSELVRTTTSHRHSEAHSRQSRSRPGAPSGDNTEYLGMSSRLWSPFRRVMSAQRRPTCVASRILASPPNPPLSPLASAPLQPLLCEVFATDAVSLGRESSSVASWTYVGDPVNARPDTVSPSAAHLLVCPSAHPPIPSPHLAQVTNPTSHAGLWKQNGSGALQLAGWSHHCCGGPLSRQHIVVSTSSKTTPCRRLVGRRLVQLGQHRLCTQP